MGVYSLDIDPKNMDQEQYTYSVGAVQAIDVQLLISLFAGRRLALRRSTSAARR